ncbi:hypothetical protein [Nocardioides sp.]|uniref:hypothetical protein n=1 Tax=Nocardioides sp. TaxID=35761 RepID=UPI00261C929D|nr:hypothetical protein [Nocardioides sp.]MBI2245238.1 hypothetical protein [Nocardioides sp.]MDI6909300.1 hypothetical protein [Nocardioides sp.]
MSPISWPVVTGTLLVGSPAIYAARVAGTLSVDTALVRLMLCAVGVWAVCSMVASLSQQAVASNRAQQQAAEAAIAPVTMDGAPAAADAAAESPA